MHGLQQAAHPLNGSRRICSLVQQPVVQVLMLTTEKMSLNKSKAYQVSCTGQQSVTERNQDDSAFQLCISTGTCGDIKAWCASATLPYLRYCGLIIKTASRCVLSLQVGMCNLCAETETLGACGHAERVSAAWSKPELISGVPVCANKREPVRPDEVHPDRKPNVAVQATAHHNKMLQEGVATKVQDQLLQQADLLSCFS